MAGPSADDISRSIEPGSTEYGDRDALAGRIQDALGGGAGGAPAPGAQVTPSAPQGGGMDPMQRLLGGAHSTDMPATSGMSVGPGSSGQATAMADSPRIEKLRSIATGAKSPYLRQLARDALRREIKRNV